MTSGSRPAPPAVAWIYGVLGLLPFVVGCGLSLGLAGVLRALCQMALLAYGGLILSFLGGGRWGMEVVRPQVRPGVISLSMLPTVFAFLLLVAPTVPMRVRLLAMALGHVGQWLWDVRSEQTPPWYPSLRHGLTAGAVLCLSVAAVAASG